MIFGAGEPVAALLNQEFGRKLTSVKGPDSGLFARSSFLSKSVFDAKAEVAPEGQEQPQLPGH